MAGGNIRMNMGYLDWTLLVTLLVPLTAVLLGATILGERLESGQFAGMALIALGLAAIDGRPYRFIRRRLAG